MPITVRVVSEEKYLEWIELAKKKYAKYPDKNLITFKKEKLN